MAESHQIEPNKSKKVLNAHYNADQFWQREPISLTREQLGNNYGWRTLLILQFQYQFQIIVLGGILVCAVVTLKDLSFVLSTISHPEEFYESKVASVLYLFDVIYTIDLLLMIIYKSITWPEVNYLYSARPGYILIIEFLSVLPFEAQFSPTKYIFHYIRARYVVRLIRIIYMLRFASKMSTTSPWLKMYVHFAGRILVLTSIFTFSVTVFYCSVEKHILTYKLFYNIMMLTSSRVTNKGFGEIRELRETIRFFETSVFLFIHLTSFIIVSYQVCRYACMLVPRMKHACSFVHRFEDIRRLLYRWKRHDVVDLRNYHLTFEKTVLNYFKMTWHQHKTPQRRYIPGGKIPQIIIKEVALDVTWDAFKHSHLFKNANVSFLRSISVFMQRNVYYRGEIVIKKNKMKSCMMYVITGILQILSEENGETPIMSFSGGSCIGESTLFIDYPSTCTVVANSYTEVYTLKKKYIIKICKLYPDIYRSLTKRIMARYNKARVYRRGFQILKDRYQLVEDVDFLPMLYVITTLKRFVKSKKVINREIQRAANLLQDFVFCADYLDMLVLPDDLQLVSDSVFVSKTFPFIFQPNSVFIDLWNFIVGLIACVLALLYPLAVCMITGDEFIREIFWIILVISVIWIIDAYIRISTAVKAKHAFHTRISDILYYRLSTLGFLADVLCMIPVGPALYLINPSMSSYVLLLLEMHKLLKVYRINDVIQKLTELNTKRMMILYYLKVLAALFVLFYYSTCIFYLLVCGNICYEQYLSCLERYYDINRTSVPHRFIQVYTVASYFVSDTTFFDYLDFIPFNYLFVIICMQIIYCCTYICVQSVVIAAEVANSQETFQFKEYMSNVAVMFTKLNFPQETNKKVFTYLKKQYFLDNGVSFLYDNSVCKVMTKNLHVLYKYVIYGKYINEIAIFADFENNLLMEIARRSHVNVYLAGEVICYAGEVCKYMYTIVHGFCTVIYRNGTEKVITVKDCISAFELCMDIPHINTVVAYTDCKLLAFSSKEFIHLSRSNNDVFAQIRKPDEETNVIIKKLLEEEVLRQPPKRIIKKKSFKIFKFTKKKSENMDYHVGFSKLWVIFKYILMRVTIIPDSRFLLAWEFSRGVFAFITNASTAMSVFYHRGRLGYFLIVLDATAWIDLYVMHHVCYYNENGLLVYHPLSTAKYYWKHRFLFDLVACLPIDYLFKHHYLYIYCRLNRFLQLYRLLMFLKHFRQLSNQHFIDILQYLPLAILVIHYISSLILINTCVTPEFTLKSANNCASGYFIAKRSIYTDYSPINAIVTNLLLTVTSFAMINTTRIRFVQVHEMLLFAIVVLIGTSFSIWLTAKMVAGNFFRNSDLTSYQQEMRNLINFYSFRKIDKNIKREIINHFEYMWMKKSGKDLNEIMNFFRPCFKEDVLYSKFSTHLTSTSIFHNAQTSFFKCLIVEMNHRVFIKRATIYRVNDIISEIYFILNGEVEILGADHNKLKVLKEGSIFGNLGKEEYTRQLLITVAKSNLEVLRIKSTIFHEILNNYSTLKSYFQELTIVNVDYLENEFTIDPVSKNPSIITQKKKKRFYDAYFKCSPLIKNHEVVRIVNNVLVVISCFIGFHYESFQKAVMDADVYTLSLLHLLDLLFIIRMFLKLHTIFIDAYGTAVKNKKEIVMHYVRQKPGLYFDIVVGAPIDLFSYFFIWSDYFPFIFNGLRIIKLLRIYLLINILQKIQEKLHINVALIRILYILTLTSVYIQLMGVTLFYSRLLTTPVLTSKLFTKYLLYKNSFLIITCTTIGAPITNFGIVFSFTVCVHLVVITVLGRFMVTIFIAETCATLEAINQSKNSYKEFSLELKEYMRSHDVSLPIRHEIEEYINLFWINYRGVLNPALLNRTPYYLKEATLNAMFGYHLRKHPLIKTFHIDLIRQMAACLEVIIFFPGNHVAYQGDVDQTMYFIHDGVVDALSEDSLETETIALTLESGDSFGLEQGLFPTTPHMYTYKVRKPTVLIALQRKSWFHLLGFFPASVEILNLYYTDPIESYDENIKNYCNY